MRSWSYGDPAPPILRAYAGDPSKIRLIHGGVKETHVFHLHNHQWKLEPDDSKSTIIDSISISPQECYTLDILYGAGSLTKNDRRRNFPLSSVSALPRGYVDALENI